MKILKGYRTLIASGLSILFGVLAQTDWVSFLNAPKAGLVSLGLGIVMGLLRLITDTPIGESTPKELPSDDEKVVDKH